AAAIATQRATWSRIRRRPAAPRSREREGDRVLRAVVGRRLLLGQRLDVHAQLALAAHVRRRGPRQGDDLVLAGVDLRDRAALGLAVRVVRGHVGARDADSELDEVAAVLDGDLPFHVAAGLERGRLAAAEELLALAADQRHHLHQAEPVGVAAGLAGRA